MRRRHVIDVQLGEDGGPAAVASFTAAAAARPPAPVDVASFLAEIDTVAPLSAWPTAAQPLAGAARHDSATDGAPTEAAATALSVDAYLRDVVASLAGRVTAVEPDDAAGVAAALADVAAGADAATAPTPTPLAALVQLAYLAGRARGARDDDAAAVAVLRRAAAVVRRLPAGGWLPAPPSPVRQMLDGAAADNGGAASSSAAAASAAAEPQAQPTSGDAFASSPSSRAAAAASPPPPAVAAPPPPPDEYGRSLVLLLLQSPPLPAEPAAQLPSSKTVARLARRCCDGLGSVWARLVAAEAPLQDGAGGGSAAATRTDKGATAATGGGDGGGGDGLVGYTSDDDNDGEGDRVAKRAKVEQTSGGGGAAAAAVTTTAPAVLLTLATRAAAVDAYRRFTGAEASAAEADGREAPAPQGWAPLLPALLPLASPVAASGLSSLSAAGAMTGGYLRFATADEVARALSPPPPAATEGGAPPPLPPPYEHLDPQDRSVEADAKRRARQSITASARVEAPPPPLPEGGAPPPPPPPPPLPPLPSPSPPAELGAVVAAASGPPPRLAQRFSQWRSAAAELHAGGDDGASRRGQARPCGAVSPFRRAFHARTALTLLLPIASQCAPASHCHPALSPPQPAARTTCAPSTRGRASWTSGSGARRRRQPQRRPAAAE
jgi:hypothetical protein